MANDIAMNPTSTFERICVALVALTVTVMVNGCGSDPKPAAQKSDQAIAATKDRAAETKSQSSTQQESETQKAKVAKADTDTNQENVPSDETIFGELEDLFAKNTLDGWEVPNFGGEGDCDVNDGVLTLGSGNPITGVSSQRDDLPKTNYEISLDARKIDGTDFFCGLTFPVAESHCTLIVGGWGGTLVGLSCIDDQDASGNDTKLIRKFEQEQWYKIRVRVQPENISVWIDEKQVIDKNIVGKKISLRNDIDLCKPLAICAFQTIAEFKHVQLRKIVDPKTETAESGAKEPANK